MDNYPIIWPDSLPVKAEAVAVKGRLMTLVQYDPEKVNAKAAERLGFHRGNSEFMGTLRILEREDWQSLFSDVEVDFKHFSTSLMHGLEIEPSSDTIPPVLKDWVAASYYSNPQVMSEVLAINEVMLPLREAVLAILEGRVEPDTTPLLRLATLDLFEREDLAASDRAKLEFLWGLAAAVDNVRHDNIYAVDDVLEKKVLFQPGEIVYLRDGGGQALRIAVTTYEDDESTRVFVPGPSLIANIPIPSVKRYEIQDLVTQNPSSHRAIDTELPLNFDDALIRPLAEVAAKLSGAEEGSVGPRFWDQVIAEVVPLEDRSGYSYKHGTCSADELMAALRSRASVWSALGGDHTQFAEAAEELSKCLSNATDHIHTVMLHRSYDPTFFPLRFDINKGFPTLEVECLFHRTSFEVKGAPLDRLTEQSIFEPLEGHRNKLLGKAEFGLRLDDRRNEPLWSLLPSNERSRLLELMMAHREEFEHELWEAIRTYEFSQGVDLSEPGRLRNSYRGSGDVTTVRALPKGPAYDAVNPGNLNVSRHRETGLCFMPKEAGINALDDARKLHFGANYAEAARPAIENLLSPGNDDLIEDAIGRLEVMEIIGRSALQSYLYMSEDERNDLISKLSIRIQTHPDILKSRPSFAEAERAQEYAKKLYTSLTQSGKTCPTYVYLAFSSSYNRWGVGEVEDDWLGSWRFAEIEKEIISRVRSRRGAGSSKVIPINMLSLIDPQLFNTLEKRAMDKAISLQESLRKGDDSKKGERQDTGVVYGLARKDLARNWTDEVGGYLSSMSDSGRQDFAKREKVWPKPKLQSLEAAGYEPAAAWLMNYYHKGVPARPPKGDLDTVRRYIEAVAELREGFVVSKTYDEAKKMLASWHQKHAPFEVNDDPTTHFNGFVKRTSTSGYLLVRRGRYYRDCPVGSSPFAVHSVQEAINRDTENNLGWSWIETNASKRKSTVERLGLHIAPQLAKVQRTGPEVLRDEFVTEIDFIKQFGFSGVEYGEWTNQSERSLCLNFAYDSFDDIARAFALPKTSLSMGGRLGLCFGSRGRGGRGAALAHFEPVNYAINLTRMKGAGSLGHEFVHGLDSMLGSAAGMGSGSFLSDWADRMKARPDTDIQFELAGLNEDILKSFLNVYRAIYYAPSSPGDSTSEEGEGPFKGAESPLVIESKAQDRKEKRKEAYWSEPCELFARACESWMAHRLESEGIRNTYLLNDNRWTSDSRISTLYPDQAHTVAISVAMEELLSHLRTKPVTIDHAIGEKMDIAVLYSHDCVQRFTDRDLMTKLCLQEVSAMLGSHVEVSIESDLRDEKGGAVSGTWLSSSRLIKLSQDFMDISVARHEIFHAAQDLLLTEAESSVVHAAFAPGTVGYESLVNEMVKDGKTHLVPYLTQPEEASAYAFQYWCDGRLDLHDEQEPKSLFTRIVDTIKRVVGISESFGVGRAEEIFERVSAGELIARLDIKDQVENESFTLRRAEPALSLH